MKTDTFRNQAEADPNIIRLHGPAGGPISADLGWRGALRERAVSALAAHLEAETWRPATSTAQTPCPGCGAWKDFHADAPHDENCHEAFPPAPRAIVWSAARR